LRTIAHLNQAASVLNYDHQVFMPSNSDKASATLGRQLAALATILHEMLTDPRIGTLMEEATRDFAAMGLPKSGKDGGGSLGTVKRILELEGGTYKKRVCIPVELAARKGELEAAANHAWVKVRAV
jgi:Zn-dependent M32 family carboxypeptidase